MRIISIRLPENYVKVMDELIRIGAYPSRSELVRAAIREYLRREIESSDGIIKIIKEP
ncbi:MAG: ribbon-helix-helix domain-containing protein [Candidatus Methanomethylicia archaeon]